jgi:uncharacterized protein YneF (UPF0154 family)
MSSQALAYFIFGLTLVILFGIIIGFYYSKNKKRQKKVEDAKYKMMDDDD